MQHVSAQYHRVLRRITGQMRNGRDDDRGGDDDDDYDGDDDDDEEEEEEDDGCHM